MTGWARIDRFLRTDPQDVGCESAMDVLHVYAELVISDPAEASLRYPGVLAHLKTCDPCEEDLAGLLAAIADAS
jgi:hypothetical protein